METWWRWRHVTSIRSQNLICPRNATRSPKIANVTRLFILGTMTMERCVLTLVVPKPSSATPSPKPRAGDAEQLDSLVAEAEALVLRYFPGAELIMA